MPGLEPPSAAAGPGRLVIARAPGRVNLIGDHTDYNDGLALPMAIDLATRVELVTDGSGWLRLTSSIDPRPATIPVGPEAGRSGGWAPPWARLAAAVVAQVPSAPGGVGRVTSSIPVGAGLSSSAAFTVALATALGVTGSPADLARFGQRAEAAVGAAVGLMDPLVIAGARVGHGMLMDFATLDVDHVPIRDHLAVVVVHSGQTRRVADSPYRTRRAECAAAAREVGRPLGRATETDLPTLADPVLRRRARHVVTECQRVRELADALRRDDPVHAGRVMVDSHRSLADDFEVSTPTVDGLVDELHRRPGVYGARMTGAGFGGCVVALARPGALDPDQWPGGAWTVRPSGGASREVVDRP